MAAGRSRSNACDSFSSQEPSVGNFQSSVGARRLSTATKSLRARPRANRYRRRRAATNPPRHPTTMPPDETSAIDPRRDELERRNVEHPAGDGGQPRLRQTPARSRSSRPARAPRRAPLDDPLADERPPDERHRRADQFHDLHLVAPRVEREADDVGHGQAGGQNEDAGQDQAGIADEPPATPGDRATVGRSGRQRRRASHQSGPRASRPRPTSTAGRPRAGPRTTPETGCPARRRSPAPIRESRGGTARVRPPWTRHPCRRRPDAPRARARTASRSDGAASSRR